MVPNWTQIRSSESDQPTVGQLVVSSSTGIFLLNFFCESGMEASELLTIGKRDANPDRASISSRGHTQ